MRHFELLIERLYLLLRETCVLLDEYISTLHALHILGSLSALLLAHGELGSHLIDGLHVVELRAEQHLHESSARWVDMEHLLERDHPHQHLVNL